MGEFDDYECPECGGVFGFGQERCPECGVEIDWDEARGVEIGSAPNKLVDPRLPPPLVQGEPPEPVFSRWGVALLLLTVVTFLGTFVLMRWDTWVQGAAEDSIGDDQRTLIHASAVATTVLAILVLLDIFRGQLTINAMRSQR